MAMTPEKRAKMEKLIYTFFSQYIVEKDASFLVKIFPPVRPVIVKSSQQYIADPSFARLV
jgi:hypothetical protein